MRQPSLPRLALLIVTALLCASYSQSSALAVEAPDRSEVVLVLDFSASILDDEAIRAQFAGALEQIADRVDATSADLVAGDTTVTIVRFATRAGDYPGCVQLELLGSRQSVVRFAACLREVAAAYRTGLTPDLTRSIGIDTNYVAAMQRAAAHLAPDAIRPAMIMFTDGKHDVSGVPVSEVATEHERLFGGRSPFALLPVGMGLSSTERGALESGLEALRIIRDIPACVTGAQFAWPQVVFDSPADAGNAVAVALQNVTCTFTVAPSALPSSIAPPTPAPGPTPGAVQSLRLTPADGRIELDWLAPATESESIVDYRIRCRTGESDWTEFPDTRSTDTMAVVDGLTNGAVYECEVAAVGATATGAWTLAPMTATPVGPPPPPAKPFVQALDHAVQIEIPDVEGQPEVAYRYECSPDQGSSWPIQTEAASSGIAPTLVRGLENGVEYVCRAYAVNDSGFSAPSPTSDVVRPCGSLVECSPVMVGILGVVGLIALVGLVVTLVALYRTRSRGYVVAVVDVIHTANLGYGSNLGLRFVRNRPGGMITGIEGARGRNAEVRVRSLGDDRFLVTDRAGRHTAISGQPILVVDTLGVGHSVTLRGFRTATASPRSSDA